MNLFGIRKLLKYVIKSSLYLAYIQVIYNYTYVKARPPVASGRLRKYLGALLPIG